MAKVDFDKLFDKFSTIKVGVIGDVMLDTYWWGHVERISPEAPVPVVALDKKELRIGGAGNVALNLVSLGAEVSILSVMGDDEDGGSLKDLFEKNDIRTDRLLRRSSRITTNKARIISRNQQMLRLDSEITSFLSPEDEASLLKNVEDYIKKEQPAVIIFEDYNKGVLSETLIRDVIAVCKTNNVITKPNLKEVKDGLNLLIEDVNISALNDIHHQLQKQIQHRISFITLSEKGVFYQDDNSSRIIPSHFRNIADVSGAGDTVIAVASLIYACTGSISLMAEIANVAGGLVCEEVGTVPINKDKLLHECKLLIS